VALFYNLKREICVFFLFIVVYKSRKWGKQSMLNSTTTVLVLYKDIFSHVLQTNSIFFIQQIHFYINRNI